MNNTNSTVIQNIINKLPPTIYFTELPDRKQALNYLQWLNTNVPEAKSLNNQDLFLRELIAKELRIVSMKIIEIEILLLVGLNTITVNDFTLDSKSLIKKLISENPDKYDLDIMYRIMAQIMTKLPKDLKERVTGKQKLDIYHKIAQYINIDNALLEKFIAFDPTINTPISMELDSGDYNTLNKNYLNELHNYEASKGYIDSNSMEYATIATNMIKPNIIQNNNIKAKYIDDNPDFMLGKNDNTLYYYDSSSGTISEMPLNSTQTPLSLQDLKTLLTSNKIKKSDIQKLVNEFTPTKQSTVLYDTIYDSSNILTQPITYFDTIKSFFTGKKYSPDKDSTLLNRLNLTHTTKITENNVVSAPNPPKYIEQQINPTTTTPINKMNMPTYNNSQINNLEKKFKERQSTYEKFTNNNNNNNNENETNFLKKIKNDNKNIENVALSFIALIILIFLLVIFNSIRNNYGKPTKTK